MSAALGGRVLYDKVMAQPGLSARTKAEMMAGAKLTKAAAAWSAADKFEEQFRERWPRVDPGLPVISILAEHNDRAGAPANDGGWMLRTSLYSPNEPVIHFPLESVDTFPSPTLMAQLMLACG